jgi:hypothetical protein
MSSRFLRMSSLAAGLGVAFTVAFAMQLQNFAEAFWGAGDCCGLCSRLSSIFSTASELFRMSVVAGWLIFVETATK